MPQCARFSPARCLRSAVGSERIGAQPYHLGLPSDEFDQTPQPDLLLERSRIFRIGKIRNESCLLLGPERGGFGEA
jgi:hypothetical protein